MPLAELQTKVIEYLPEGTDSASRVTRARRAAASDLFDSAQRERAERMQALLSKLAASFSTPKE